MTPIARAGKSLYMHRLGYQQIIKEALEDGERKVYCIISINHFHGWKAKRLIESWAKEDGYEHFIKVVVRVPEPGLKGHRYPFVEMD
jgi:hypothetical protein